MKILDDLALLIGKNASDQRFLSADHALVLYHPGTVQESLAKPPANVTGFDPTDDDAELDEWFGDEPKLAGTLGILIPRQQAAGLWTVERVVALDGYGPLLYTILAELAARNGAILIPSTSRSEEADLVWGKFHRNSFVERVPTPASQLGFGIVGNGTLDFSGAVRADAMFQAELTPDDRRILVESAAWWCDMAMKLLD